MCPHSEGLKDFKGSREIIFWNIYSFLYIFVSKYYLNLKSILCLQIMNYSHIAD